MRVDCVVLFAIAVIKYRVLGLMIFGVRMLWWFQGCSSLAYFALQFLDLMVSKAVRLSDVLVVCDL